MKNTLQKWSKRGWMSMVMPVVFTLMTGSINAQFFRENIPDCQRDYLPRFCLSERLKQHIRYQSYELCRLEAWMLCNNDWGPKSIREEKEMEVLLPWMYDIRQWLKAHSTADTRDDPEQPLEEWMFDFSPGRKKCHSLAPPVLAYFENTSPGIKIFVHSVVIWWSFGSYSVV